MGYRYLLLLASLMSSRVMAADPVCTGTVVSVDVGAWCGSTRKLTDRVKLQNALGLLALRPLSLESCVTTKPEVSVDLFKASVVEPGTTDLVVQVRGSLCKAGYVDYREGVLLHPLGGKRYCATRLPFLGSPTCDVETFGFVRALQAGRDSFLVETGCAPGGNEVIHGLSVWDYQRGALEAVLEYATEDSGAGTRHSSSSLVAHFEGGFPRLVSIEVTTQWSTLSGDEGKTGQTERFCPQLADGGVHYGACER